MKYASLDMLFSGFVGRDLARLTVGMAGVHYDFASERIEQKWYVQHSVLTNARILIRRETGERLLETEAFPPFAAEGGLQALLVGRRARRILWDSQQSELRMEFHDGVDLSLVLNSSDERQYMCVFYYPEGRRDWRMTEGFVIRSGATMPC